MKKYKVGIIGYGWVATAHIAAINATKQAEVAAVYSSRQLNEMDLSNRHGGEIRCFTDLDEMLASDINVVSICSYPYDHAGQSVAAAKAGKHLIIEKPLALNLKDLRRMADAINDSGVKTCVCFECRYSSQFLATKSVLDHGLLGKVHYGEIDYYHGIGPWYGQFRWNIRKNAGGSSLLPRDVTRSMHCSCAWAATLTLFPVTPPCQRTKISANTNIQPPASLF